MNLQQQDQFSNMVSRLKANSRAASLSTRKDDVLVTEIVDGLIVSKPAKKNEYLSEPSKTSEPEPEAQVWNLTKDGPVLEQVSKAASVPGINKVKVIAEFLNGRHN